jgi:hypothetical protein
VKEGEENPEFDDGNASDRLYLPKDDDSTISGDHEFPEYDQEENPQGYHEDPGLGNDEDPGVDGEADINDNGDAIEPNDVEEDPLLEDLNLVEDDAEEDEEIESSDIGDVDEESSILEDANDGSSDADEEVPKRKNTGLNGDYWNRKGEANYCLSIIEKVMET